jgi:hypothetical protein
MLELSAHPYIAEKALAPEFQLKFGDQFTMAIETNQLQKLLNRTAINAELP